MENIDLISKIAADWWVKIISNPTFDNGSDNDDWVALAATNAMMAEVTPESLEMFREKLEKEIKNLVVNDYDTYTIECDYQPDELLAKVAAECNIHRCRFPWKTFMLINVQEVIAREGYNGKKEILYRKEGI